jgi:uncharacterized radical SAM superfamily Fe-S cluster-containing enzyme
MAEVTNRCNLACPMCTREAVSFELRDMDLAFIKKLLDDNPQCRSFRHKAETQIPLENSEYRLPL